VIVQLERLVLVHWYETYCRFATFAPIGQLMGDGGSAMGDGGSAMVMDDGLIADS
jgi:hypothetical protein